MILALLWPGLAMAAPRLPVAGYDDNLCVTAQRRLANAPDVPVRVQRGQGNGFYTIQMSIDETAGELVVAMTTAGLSADGNTFPGWVGCKMVDRDRVADVLDLPLTGPRRSCRDVNEHTWQVAWAGLSEAEQARYRSSGRTLEFGDDALLPTGGEWLPADPADYLEALPDGGWRVHAPSVRVPWDTREREFFQGTQHCKLLTLASMERWLRVAAFDPDGTPLPQPPAACTAPAALESVVGSCLFYFAPVDAMVCQDYSGSGWTGAAAAAECGQRHASRAALLAAGNRYEGSGGRFDARDCASREDVPAREGTCVFQCGAGDETLWHLPDSGSRLPAGACDLFIPAP